MGVGGGVGGGGGGGGCFFFNDTATTEIYTLSLHDALPILPRGITFGRGVADSGGLVCTSNEQGTMVAPETGG